MKRNLIVVLASVALLITGVTIPKLDGSTKEPGYLDVSVAATAVSPDTSDATTEEIKLFTA
jgi:hypothetical protein